MGKLILVRGLPGSGKSTFASGLIGFSHYEADMYFARTGQYLFDATKLKDAHKWCLESAKKDLEDGKDVVVSNTFTRKWEMQQYLDFSPDADIITMHGNYNNIHGVPESIIENMRQRWED